MSLQRHSSKRRKSVALRVSKHINDFLRIHVRLSDGNEFPIMVDRNMTVEYIAKQIEAEYTCRYLLDEKRNTSDKMKSMTDLLQEENFENKMLTIFQLYDSSNLPISFSEKVGNVIVFDDYVYPIMSDEGSLGVILDECQTAELTTVQEEMGSVFLTEACSTVLIADSTIDMRLMTTLHNIIAIQFFNEFCLQEYAVENVLFWIEVEIFKTISQEDYRKLFARHIYLNYLKLGSPLCINISAELRDELSQQELEENPQQDMFDEIQNVVYILIKQHAYVRYESSATFKKFLLFKETDRYSYTQGKTVWDFDEMMILKGQKIITDKIEILELIEDPNSDEAKRALNLFADGQYPSISSALFRQRVLSTIISHYLPIVSPVILGYFDADSRQEWAQKHKKMHKQKKLTKFFGDRPDTEILQSQVTSGTRRVSEPYVEETGDNESENRESIKLSMDDADKRKKVDKLTGFFGDQLPKRQMKSQNLVEETQLSSALSASELKQEVSIADPDVLIDTINELKPEEKSALTKRAKKLLMMLGENLDQRNLSDAIPTKPVGKFNEADFDSSEFEEIAKAEELVDSTDQSLADGIEGKLTQKQRLDKLSHFLGHRIAETEVINQSATQQTARPLTSGEKKLYQKKAGKLERLLGSAVPAENIVNYGTKSDDNLNDEDDQDLETEKKPNNNIADPLDSDEDDRKVKLNKLRKLRKMFGIEISSLQSEQEISEIAIKEIEESINSQVKDPEYRALLYADLNTLKLQHKKTVMSSREVIQDS
ncbi:hypothetical protein HDV06_004100 [Boothiomyces sp. JEL0866]|nr:hypothetical protein HDV06_007081 [Boothiomyces sp. JEL0866]KAJ3321564.1 hypothetical protein HDV06_004100 [Boothiomyces sp. JEL0866]